MKKAPTEVLMHMLESEPPYDSLSTEFERVEDAELHYELLRCQTLALDSACYWYPDDGGKRIGLLFERKPHFFSQLNREGIDDDLFEHLKDLRRANVNFSKLRAEDCYMEQCGTITWRYLPSRDGCWCSVEEVMRTRDRLLKDAQKKMNAAGEDAVVSLPFS
ncbi:MAG: hypothetical protein M1813_009699 [Trichoglossum hirsutum]|nr:MAG: hypothetical protein M1813_009699 [Trichoglossum hirsutum]